MGSNYSDIEDDFKNDEKQENEKKDNSKPSMDSFNISSKFPTNENQPVILADNIYLQKNSKLGKKHSRPKDSNEEDIIFENNKKMKKEDDADFKVEKDDKIDKDENNKLDIDNENNKLDLDNDKNKSDIDNDKNKLDIDNEKNKLDIDNVNNKLDIDNVNNKLDIENEKNKLDIDNEKNKLDIDNENNKLDIDNENNKLDIDNDIKKEVLELQKEQSIEIEIIEHKKEKKLKVESNARIKYSDDSSLITEQLLKTKMNKIDNTNKFTIKSLYDNKLEIEEDMKKQKLEEKILSSYVVFPNKENNKMEEEKKNNSDDSPKKINENSFKLFAPDNFENKENNIIKLQIKNNLDNKGKENINKIINQEDLYSYECLNNNLYIKGMRGIDQLFINIRIKNNGKSDWPKENIYLKNDLKKSQIIADEIKLISLMSGWESEEKIVYKYLNNLKPGLYYSYINLNINGKNYGKPMEIKVEILENEEEKKINNLINKIRNDFQIPINEKSDEQLKNALIANNFDTTKAFESLFTE